VKLLWCAMGPGPTRSCSAKAVPLTSIERDGIIAQGQVAYAPASLGLRACYELSVTIRARKSPPMNGFSQRTGVLPWDAARGPEPTLARIRTDGRGSPGLVARVACNPDVQFITGSRSGSHMVERVEGSAVSAAYRLLTPAISSRPGARQQAGCEALEALGLLPQGGRPRSDREYARVTAGRALYSPHPRGAYREGRQRTRARRASHGHRIGRRRTDRAPTLPAPPAVWELIESREPTREGDVILYDGEGTPVAYARPAR
jgi:hypothetical protein